MYGSEFRQEYFDEAVELAISDKQPYSWSAAWLLWSVVEENDRRIREFIKRIVNAAKTKSDSHQQELLKFF